jgi:Endomembrane protein 70
MISVVEVVIFTDFVADHPKSEYCSVTLTDDSYQAFVYAIKNHYWYQMYVDDLPIWGAYEAVFVHFKI